MVLHNNNLAVKAAIELARRKHAVWDINDQLHAQQLEVFNNLTKLNALSIGRRWGKTMLCVFILLDTALKHSNSRCLYIGVTHSKAKKIVWKDLLLSLKFKDVNAQVNASSLTVTLTNGSTIQLTGCNNERAAKRERGEYFDEVIIDEGASMEPYLGELVTESLKPALTDVGGRLTLVGTPGPTKFGFFYEACQGQHGFKVFGPFDCRANTKLLEKRSKREGSEYTAEMLWKELLEGTYPGMSESDPIIQREMFGRWTEDAASLVWHYDASKNHMPIRPTPEIRSMFNIPQEMTYVLGIDTGYNDSTALVLLGFGNYSSRVYLIDEYVAPNMSFHNIVDKARAMISGKNVISIPIDSAAAGTHLSDELRNRFGLPCHPATKGTTLNSKADMCRLMDSFMQQQELFIDKDSRCARDMMHVTWKRTHDGILKPNGGEHSDAMDACLYAWLDTYAHINASKKPDKSLSVEDEHEKRLMERIQNKQRNSPSPWRR